MAAAPDRSARAPRAKEATPLAQEVAREPELAILCWGWGLAPFTGQPRHPTRGAVGLGKGLELGGSWS